MNNRIRNQNKALKKKNTIMCVLNGEVMFFTRRELAAAKEKYKDRLVVFD